MDTELQGFTINRDKVLFDTSFELPGDLGSQAVNGQVIPSDILVLSNRGLTFGGTDEQIRLPDIGFSFFKLFDVQSTNQTLSYVSNLDEIRYQGKFVVDAPIKGVDNSLTVDLLDPNYAAVRDGEAEFKGKLELETDVSLGKFAFKGFAIEIDTTSVPETIKGATTFEFPMKARTPELEATLGFALDPFTINTVGLEVDKLNIPVPGVQLLFLNKLGLTIDHLAPHDTAAVGIEGLVGFTFGPKITLPAVFGISESDLALVSADITGEVSGDGLGGGISVSLINDGILNVEGSGELNWTD